VLLSLKATKPDSYNANKISFILTSQSRSISIRQSYVASSSGYNGILSLYTILVVSFWARKVNLLSTALVHSSYIYIARWVTLVLA